MSLYSTGRESRAVWSFNGVKRKLTHVFPDSNPTEENCFNESDDAFYRAESP
jgi:hypothetical protein